MTLPPLSWDAGMAGARGKEVMWMEALIITLVVLWLIQGDR